ncbi:insulin-like growth factor-binding protein complex acid labile subunit [Neocloeon triangulifer]|uniref:insulin-like growth factor-binding protein complex acid labile subunit n=1 Tax=Neocloeon triangulifer TaxID=2078957 RepID=UPI00286F473F|nr:insulin-like growth factor-binding protein complex acid labile subunit [Neocloeon triangulifer]
MQTVKNSLLLLSLFNLSCLAQKCPSNCTCPEHPEDLFLLVCPGLNGLILPNHTLQLDCLPDFDPQRVPSLLPSAPEVSLTNCPPDVFVSSNTKSLFIRNISLPVSRVRLGEWTNLEKLDISNNHLEILPSRLLNGLNGLRQLDLSRCHLYFIYPSCFKDFALLKELYLEDNSLTEIEENQFQELSALWLLHLWGNRISKLTNASFFGLGELRHLDLSHNRIHAISSDVLAPLIKLKHLDLSNNRFQVLPGDLLRYNIHLEVFKFESNFKGSLFNPDAEWLQSIELPQGLLSDLRKLKRVSFADSAVAFVPRFLLRGSESLTHLDLRGNRLSTIPKFFLQDVQNLKWLDLSHNNLENLTDDFLSRTSSSLEYLNLSSNSLATMPKGSFYEFVYHLDVRHNQLDRIPSEIVEQLRKNLNLREFYFVTNNLWNCEFINTKELFRIITQIVEKGVASDYKNRCPE